MTRTLLAGVLGGFILLVWGILAWMVLPMHKDTIQKLPNEDAVVAALQSTPGQGVYYFPAMPENTSDKAAMDAYTERYRRGPMGMIVYDPNGGDPMMVSNIIVGLLIYILAALVAAWFYERSTALAGTLLQRLSFFGMLGIFLSLATYFANWNWMGYPLSFTTSMALDTIIGWVLAGYGISLVVKPPKTVGAEQAVKTGATA
jgi:hypothetical protein